MMCRKATEDNPDNKENIADLFESTLDTYYKMKGIKKE